MSPQNTEEFDDFDEYDGGERYCHWMRDVWFAGRCLRVFYRGWECPLLPYYFHRYGLHAFGLLCIGFMFWPKPDGAASLGGRTE